MTRKFIKTFGTAAATVPVDWITRWSDALEAIWFPKQPRSIRQGDLLVYYAAGRRCICAIAEVVSDGGLFDEPPPPTWSPADAKRWPWCVRVRPHLAIPADEHAPTLEQIGFSPLRVRRQSHVGLTEAEYERFVRELLRAAGRSAEQPA